MQVLQFCTKFWKFLGLFKSSNKIDPDTNEFLKSIMSWIVLFNSSILMVVASGIFIVRFLSNFDEVTVEMEVFCAGIQAVGVYLPIGLKMFDAKRMILEIQSLADRGILNIHKHSISRNFTSLTEVEKLHTFEWKFIFFCSTKNQILQIL